MNSDIPKLVGKVYVTESIIDPWKGIFLSFNKAN